MTTDQEFNPYKENGYENRKEYLKAMAEDHGVPYGDVLELAQILGPEEDFDGLVTNLQDYPTELD